MDFKQRGIFTSIHNLQHSIALKTTPAKKLPCTHNTGWEKKEEYLAASALEWV